MKLGDLRIQRAIGTWYKYVKKECPYSVVYVLILVYSLFIKWRNEQKLQNNVNIDQSINIRSCKENRAHRNCGEERGTCWDVWGKRERWDSVPVYGIYINNSYIGLINMNLGTLFKQSTSLYELCRLFTFWRKY